MFDRFTDRARAAVHHAQEEARRLGHQHLGTEHLLVGVLREPAGVGAKALGAFDVSLETVRSEIEHRLGRGTSEAPGQLTFSPGAKQSFEFALREAKAMGHDYLGTEHLTLGLVRVHDGAAARILADCYAIDRDGLLDHIVALLPDTGPSPRGRRSRPFLQRPVLWHMPEDAVAVNRRRRLLLDLEAVLDENARLRKLLREHGIDPDERPGDQSGEQPA
jgi:ATP-dependent Clp protease ATP-binding subunit ClpC